MALTSMSHQTLVEEVTMSGSMATAIARGSQDLYFSPPRFLAMSDAEMPSRGRAGGAIHDAEQREVGKVPQAGRIRDAVVAQVDRCTLNRDLVPDPNRPDP